ncbi:TonB dependent receptor [compost metagenome]
MVDLGARYQLNKHTQLMAGVYNLFDVDPQRISPWGDYGLVEGRRYNLGARIEF